MQRSYKRSEERETAVYKDAGLRKYNNADGLADPSMRQSRQELEPQLANQIQTIFPGLVLQQIQNTQATRWILPKAPDKFEMILPTFVIEMTVKSCVRFDSNGPILLARRA